MKTIVVASDAKGSARPRAEAKRPPMGADGRCPACRRAKRLTAEPHHV